MDVVSWLTAELDRAEQLARAASGGQGWWMIDPRYADHRTIVEYVIEGERGKVAHIDVYEHDPEAHRAEALLIQANNPAAVLRRVAAGRKILAEHQPTREGPARRADPWDPCELPGCPCAVEDRVPACGMCASGHAYDAVVEHYPCRTVLLLAEAWGWTE